MKKRGGSFHGMLSTANKGLSLLERRQKKNAMPACRQSSLSGAKGKENASDSHNNSERCLDVGLKVPSHGIINLSLSMRNEVSSVNPNDDLARGIFDLNTPQIGNVNRTETEIEPYYSDDDWM